MTFRKEKKYRLTFSEQKIPQKKEFYRAKRLELDGMMRKINQVRKQKYHLLRGVSKLLKNFTS